jgi:LysR family transcriptional regulator for metE and metH
MHIEFRHLRTIKAIHEEGGLARAAERLHITQSALSHQIKGLEDQAGVELFVRRSRPMRLSSAGMKLLRLAEDVLPRLAALEEEFEGLRSGKSGRLHIAIECHACFDWLLPVLEAFRDSWPEVDVDIRPGLQFEALPALLREEVDLVVSSDPEELPGVDFTPLFDYEPVFVCAADHPLAAKDWIEAEDFAEQHLITYPVERARLGRVQPAPVPGGGGAAVDPAGGAVGGDAASGGVGARGGGAARLGGAGPAHARIDRDAAPDGGRDHAAALRGDAGR